MGLSLPLRMITYNGLELYMHRVYWEKIGKPNVHYLNIVSGGFPPHLTFLYMVPEVIDNGK